MKTGFYFLLIAVLIVACKNTKSPSQQVVKDALGREVGLKAIPSVFIDKKEYDLEKWRNGQNNLWIVYLSTGCRDCYRKFGEWQLKMDSIGMERSNQVLFIINGNDISGFLSIANETGVKYSRYALALDKDAAFLNENAVISQLVFANGIMIDKRDRVRMVGAPFTTPQMTELYRKICSQ
jgi:hypothetical protein